VNISATVDHNQLIARAAKAALAPLGCMQKGRSRIWFSDHGWWLAVIEFQPTSWGKGSYLNAAAMWLWNAKDHWSFDEGGRVEAFHDFRNEEPFSKAAQHLAASATAEVASLRGKFPSIEAVAAHLEKKQKTGIWDHYHAALSAALVGRSAYAQSQFEEVALTQAHAPWVTDIQAKAKTFSKVAWSVDDMRHAVTKEVIAARALLKLPPLSNGNLWT
jgi:hypothetical protein